MDISNQNNLNKNTQNEDFVGGVIECGTELVSDGLETIATNNAFNDINITTETIEPLDLEVDDIEDGGILETLLDNLDDIPIVGIVIGLIVVIGGIIFAITKLKKK